MKKVLLICVTSQNAITFRKKLIERLKNSGCTVSLIAFDDAYKNEIEKLGVDFHCINDSNRSINPLRILTLEKKYRKIIEMIAPDTVSTFMLKPNVFGARAAVKAGIQNVYAMVEGAGDIFVNNSLKWKMIRTVVCHLYRSSMKRVKKVFFLNEDDRELFLEKKLVTHDQTELIHGIGVDLDFFSCRPIQKQGSFLMIARMLKTKGVLDYCEAARKVKQKYPSASFRYLGAEGTVTLEDIKTYIDDGSIEYLGTTRDVRPYLEESDVFVLPSYYREGLSMSIMEAASMGRATLTYDNVGCRDAVLDAYNGFLLPLWDTDALAEKMIWCIEHPEEIKRMGDNSRRFAEEHFDQKKINQKVCSVIGVDVKEETVVAN